MPFEEKDMYGPLKDYFINRGYKVRAEIETIDFAACKEDWLVLVEMKKNFNLKLLFQAIRAKEISRYVYVAVAHANWSRKRRSEIKKLCRELHIGCLLIDMLREKPEVEILIENPFMSCEKHVKQKHNKKTKRVLKELQGRSVDFNIAGVRRKKLVTAYREKALTVAWILMRQETVSLAEIKKNFELDASKILQNNYYGWFLRVKRGVYTLNKNKRSEIEEFSNVLQHIEKVHAHLGPKKEEYLFLS